LCDAAIQLLADHGANGVTHRKVDRQAGVPDGTTSFYFRTRLALLRGVAERVAELDLADLRSAGTDLATVVVHAGTEPWRSRTRARYELMLQAMLSDEKILITGPAGRIGKFRAVISRLDPGVPNRLDKGDYPWGIIQMRWNQATDYPDPTITKVPFAEIRDHLPAGTPTLTPEERKAALRVRREGAQLRRIW
jgi:AcrR family transcriptional regulator